jgi:hypothetical protein
LSIQEAGGFCRSLAVGIFSGARVSRTAWEEARGGREAARRQRARKLEVEIDINILCLKIQNSGAMVRARVRKANILEVRS